MTRLDFSSWDNYIRFVSAVISTEKKSISRNFREEYIPEWSDRNDELHEQFAATGKQEVAEELSQGLSTSSCGSWMNTHENINFKKSSDNVNHNRKEALISPNNIASHPVNTSRAQQIRKHTIKIKRGTDKSQSSAFLTHNTPINLPTTKLPCHQWDET